MIFKNVFVRIFLIIVIILLIIQIFASFFLTGFVNKKLSVMFLSKVHIARLNVNLFDQSVSLSNLKINQPKEISQEELLFLKKLKVRISIIGLLKKKIHIKKIFLSNLKLNAEKDKKGIFNFEKILPSDKKNTQKSTKSSDSAFSIQIDKVLLDKITVNYSEKNESSLELNLQHLALAVNDIKLSDQNIISNVILSIPKFNFSTNEKDTGKVNLSLSNVQININSIVNKGFKSSVKDIMFSIKESDFGSLKKDKSSVQAVLSAFKINVSDINVENGNVKILKTVTEFSNAKIVASSSDSLKSNLSLGEFSISLDRISAAKDKASLKKIATKKFALNLQSGVTKSDSISLSLEDILLNVTNVIYQKKIDDAKSMPTNIEFTTKIDNDENYDSFIGLYAQSGVLSDKIPRIKAALRVVGFELDKFASLIPMGTYQMLGGDALDITTDVEIKQDSLDCKIKIVTNQGTKLGMKIGGTPQKPELDKSSALFNVFTRFQGGIGGTIFKMGGTTVGVAKTGLNVAAGVGKGTGEVIGSVGKGAFSTLKGIATGNVKTVGKGLKQATVGTVSETGKTVLNSGKEVIKGSGNAVKNITGKKQADKWRQAKKGRWNNNWKEAKEEIDKIIKK